MIVSDGVRVISSARGVLRPSWRGKVSAGLGRSEFGDPYKTGAILLADMVSSAVVFGLVLPSTLGLAGPSDGSIPTFAIAAVAALLFLACAGHYNRRIPYWSELQGIVLASLVAFALNGLIVFLLKQDQSRLQLMAPWALLPFIVVTVRRLTREALKRAGLWQIRSLIVGVDETARHVRSALMSESGLGYEVVGILGLDEMRSHPAVGAWRALLRRYDASLVILAFDPAQWPARNFIECLVRERVPFAMISQQSGLPVLGFEQTRFFSHDTVMFTYRNNLAKPAARLLKFVFDYVAALCALLVMAPVFLLIIAAVKLDGGPAFFGHVRIGAGGIKFRCLKFRSMVTDSEAVLQNTLENDPVAAEEWACSQKLRNDPRITRVGAFLRKTSLDELPQLINVLRLEMSLVGPRPIVDAEVPRYGDDITFYHETRPGITGLWQVSGRTDTTYEHRVQLDTWYAKNWTIWHDFVILAKTVPAVFHRRGAC